MHNPAPQALPGIDPVNVPALLLVREKVHPCQQGRSIAARLAALTNPGEETDRK